ncbi:hypothetical protein [Agrobacterium pusense]|uniref:Uncharacterized protein n=2 Tax=Rhizobium/Agrobacterium group TaxID=227290 RepID=A0AA44EQQ6_9HYPH|nr:hypothetical protein [Agrobacterium pusense]NRF12620.1 hypothetical protein [Agrobacterium pusense]NRF23331.1 hypothetical protein [Agrobacterium pusense]
MTDLHFIRFCYSIAVDIRGEPMRQTLAAAIVALLGASPALADANEDFVWATQIAAVIGSADACGFKLDDAKVKALASNKIAKMDSGTRSNFYATLTLTPNELSQLSATAKVAQCAMQSEVAKREGLAP